MGTYGLEDTGKQEVLEVFGRSSNVEQEQITKRTVLSDSNVRYYALVSGGKDSMVLAHYLHSKGALKGCIFIDTGIAATGLREWIEKIPYPLEIYPTPIRYEWFVWKYGFPRYAGHNWAFNYLKGRALRELRKKHEGEDSFVLASGVRKLESARRFRNVQATSDLEGMECHAPLLEWSTPEIWSYVNRHAIDISPCYQTMHYSGDCFCGSFAQPGEKTMLKIFYPEVWDRIRKLEEQVGGSWGNTNLPTKRDVEQAPLTCYECTLVQTAENK